jgi:hypothetical protein
LELRVKNPAEGMDVCVLCLVFVVCCAGSGLCDELITGSEDSHWVSVLNYVIKKQGGDLGPNRAVATQKERKQGSLWDIIKFTEKDGL